mgnify:CR=1 FL=1
MVLVAITGGIAAGKSTVLQNFERLGARTFDADEAVHELYRESEALRNEVVERWGAEVLDEGGHVRRDAVGAIVFRDPQERKWLNERIHPAVQQRMVEEAARDNSPLFCAIPLLFEVGWDRKMDTTVAVWCDPGTQRERLAGRGWSEEEYERRAAAQWSMNKKLEQADFGLINTGTRDLLLRQCEAVRAIVTTRMKEYETLSRGDA